MPRLSSWQAYSKGGPLGVQVRRADHGLVHTIGSSIVNEYSIRPSATRVQRSTRRRFFDDPSNLRRSLKLVVSTTRVSPSVCGRADRRAHCSTPLGQMRPAIERNDSRIVNLFLINRDEAGRLNNLEDHPVA